MLENTFEERYNRLKSMVEEELRRIIDNSPTIPKRLLESMAYSLQAGGKRLRPVLCLEACHIAGGNEKDALPIACAYEMIHTYSLIHDDLPSMDNDTLRRGKPTNHVVFGETLAILAGDGLQAWAFEIALNSFIKNQNINPKNALKSLYELAKACGPTGMVGGQVLDTDEITIKECMRDELSYIEETSLRKTAALIKGALLSGAYIGNPDEKLLNILSSYGTYIGIMFQVIDDILDITGDKNELGKSVGKDLAQNKKTFATTLGIDEARLYAYELYEQALVVLEELGEKSWFLRELASKLLERKK